jgi:hypothetical protein
LKLTSPKLRIPTSEVASLARHLMTDHGLTSIAVSEVVDNLLRESFYAGTKPRRKAVEVGMALRTEGWTSKSTRSSAIKNGLTVPTSIPTSRYFPPKEGS